MKVLIQWQPREPRINAWKRTCLTLEWKTGLNYFLAIFVFNAMIIGWLVMAIQGSLPFLWLCVYTLFKQLSSFIPIAPQKAASYLTQGNRIIFILKLNSLNPYALWLSVFAPSPLWWSFKLLHPFTTIHPFHHHEEQANALSLSP